MNRAARQYLLEVLNQWIERKILTRLGEHLRSCNICRTYNNAAEHMKSN